MTSSASFAISLPAPAHSPEIPGLQPRSTQVRSYPLNPIPSVDLQGATAPSGSLMRDGQDRGGGQPSLPDRGQPDLGCRRVGVIAGLSLRAGTRSLSLVAVESRLPSARIAKVTTAASPLNRARVLLSRGHRSLNRRLNLAKLNRCAFDPTPSRGQFGKQAICKEHSRWQTRAPQRHPVRPLSSWLRVSSEMCWAVRAIWRLPTVICSIASATCWVADRCC